MAIISTNQAGGNSTRDRGPQDRFRSAAGAASHNRSLTPKAADAKVRMLNNLDAIGAATSRMYGRVMVPDGVDLERLRIRAAELEQKIGATINGERARLETMRSDCLKAIGQLTLMKVKLP